MKNLRKVLAVILVVAMAFSVMVVASAKQVTDFSDASGIKYTEAVDLLAGLGVIQGGGSTTFNPNDTLTREQAAKIITYMLLGSSVADALSTSTSSFSDVAANRWSAPFIQYCVGAGIINGMGNGKFGPEQPVTGTMFAKLALTALGYGAKGEYTGANWELNTLVKAQALGILNTGVNYSAPATRQEVAKYAFNALTACNPVNFNSVTGAYADTSTNADTQKNTLGYATFALYKTSAPGSFYGVTSHFWKAYTTTVPAVISGTYSDDTVLYTSTNGTSIANLTTVNSGFYKVPLAASVNYWINGSETANQSSILSAANTASQVRGAIVKFVDNSKDGLVDNVFIIQKTVSQLTSTPSVDASGSVRLVGTNGISGTYTPGTIVYPAGLALNDYVSYVTVGTITYVEKATAVHGVMTAANDTLNTITFAGTTYTKANLVGNSFLDTTASANYNVNATGYVDSNGYLLVLATDTVTSYNYGLVVGYAYTASNGVSAPSAQAILYTNDGKVATYSVAPNPSTGIVPNQGSTGTGATNDFNFPTGHSYMVSYTINASGQVTLTPAPLTASSINYTAKASTITIGANVYYITSATKVIYFDGTQAYNAASNVATVTTGYLTATVGLTSGNVTYARNAIDNNKLDAIFINAPAPTGVSASYAYISNPAYNLRVVNGVNYYDYTGYVNGTATTLTAYSAAISSAGLYGYSLDSTGNVVTASISGISSVAATGKVTYVDSAFIGYVSGAVNRTLATDSSTKYFQVNTTSGVVTATDSIPASVTGGSTTTLTYFYMNTANTAAAQVYYTVS